MNNTADSQLQLETRHVTSRQSNYRNNQENAPSNSHLRDRIIQIFIDLICIVLTFVAFILVYFLLDPKIRGFFCTDTDIFNPYKDDTVEFWVVGVFGTVGPVVFIITIELINSKLILCNYTKRNYTPRYKRKLFAVSAIHALSLFVLGISITLLLTEIGKRWVGRLRPHFIAVCDPDFTKITCSYTAGLSSNVIYNYIDTTSICRNDAKKVQEARLSFPSGHSSYSSYTMLFLIIYIEARLKLLRFRFVKPGLQMTAFAAAYVTCVSRVSDYHHRGSDVIGGIVLGCIIAVFMTFVVGRVLWKFNYRESYHDFDFKPVKL